MNDILFNEILAVFQARYNVRVHTHDLNNRHHITAVLERTGRHFEMGMVLKKMEDSAVVYMYYDNGEDISDFLRYIVPIYVANAQDAKDLLRMTV